MSTQLGVMPQQDSNEGLQKPQAVPARYAHFGVFLADFERAELYQNGQRVKVQAKLFQALVLLVRRAGDVVSREEVRRQLWPEAFLTNLDANVNTTINKLRQVLGDSPESPLYIETIPRRGYSFVAIVEFSDVPSEAPLEVANKKSLAEPQANRIAPVRFDRALYVFARVATLLFGGMILGALLTFVWIFSQAKYRRASNGAPIRSNGAPISMSVAECGFQQLIGLSRENHLRPPM
jgi:DNA-binding winged helix-turn-helix (wHTH) protein